MSQIPKEQIAYVFTKHEGIENLTQATIPVVPPKRNQVLIKVHATSLNYRDLMVASAIYPGPFPSQLIPLSDGAGEIVELGEDVTEFKVGDRVCGLFHQDWLDGEMRDDCMSTCLGASLHGMLTQYRTLDVNGIIKFPSHLSYEEAATLPCAALTAWNSLAENKNQTIGPNQSVLVLGTGGVSIFAIQFAVAAGARVIVASSSDEKLERAKKLGATDLINYKNTPDWHERVRELTGGRGVDHVVEVGGAGTLERSLKAVRRGGQVHMIGVLSGPQATQPDIGLLVLFGGVNMRGILVGSRGMFQNMNRALENNQQIKPVVDRVFEYGQALEAFKYFQSQQHFGKVVIRVD